MPKTTDKNKYFVVKERAVPEVLLNVVMQEIHGNMTVNYVNLQGLKCGAFYHDTETGKIYNGAALMEAGIPMPVEMGEFKAYQMHLVAEE